MAVTPKVVVLEEGKRIRIDGVRLSFPSLFTPVSYKGETDKPAKYNATVLIPKSATEVVSAINAQIEKAIQVLFETPQQIKKAKDTMRNQPNYHILKDGDLKEERDGYPGHVYLHASNTRKPLIRSSAGVELVEDDGSIQAGDYVSILVTFYKSHKYNIISASFNGIQKVATGDRFASGAANASDFDGVACEEATGTDGEENPYF